MIGLESFIVLKSLSVNNIIVESKKVQATYSVTKFSGETSSYQLIYSYDNPYFKKNNPPDVNLASMMLAQVAVNYGLFFETIEFDGVYDKTDQQFLREMTENTSREIITNKLLIKNEFIKAPYDSLITGKRDRYTQAKIIFNNTYYTDLKASPTQAAWDYNKYAILSSGGKDSLLTYGIIKETGIPYPVFINEAGRHWFTAVNAYRYYKNTDPNTEKPWCNSDRLFNWMLKQLPFIKENYASIRADIYPLRLWTVAVFLFGVIPVALKKGIGNILIGDEYDTTLKGNKSGISHYNALYDQSKYFDNYLTRYYFKKGWQIYQYSILRSLSEMLIMKVLIKRYPDLQEHQVSCHAAHEMNGRMYPCGKCEKCRRIVGMLRALDENPQRCGYSEAQIQHCLEELSSKPVKQIGSDAEQLYFMLQQKNLLKKNNFTRLAAKEHSEIMKLRFDNERSKLEDLPVHIRKPLFEILSPYATSAAKLVQKRWIDFELSDEDMETIKYKYDER